MHILMNMDLANILSEDFIKKLEAKFLLPNACVLNNPLIRIGCNLLFSAFANLLFIYLTQLFYV